MQSQVRLVATRALVALAAVAMLAACDDNDNNGTGITVGANNYTVTRLVASPGGPTALTTDADLINAWGLTFGANGNLVVAAEGTGMSSVYDPVTGAKQNAVSVMSGLNSGEPTGIVYNGTQDFGIGVAGPATFLYAGEDGHINAWNPTLGSTAVSVASSPGAVYKALAIAPLDDGQSLLFATDFKNNTVDVYDASFNLVNSFTDPDLPANYAPFGAYYIGGHVWVTYAKKASATSEEEVAGAGNGLVDVFTVDGGVARRFATGGALNAPWGIAIAPSTGFGGQSNRVLIGNFGDGRIAVYTPGGDFVTYLHDANGADISIDGLWGITFGPAGSSNANTLYFAAGPSDETQGLVGSISPQ